MNTFTKLPFDKFEKIFEDEQKKEESKNSLNIFKIISKKYYYENFHSDIICNLLCSKINRIDGKDLMGIFVECLNEAITKQKQELNCKKIQLEKFLKDYVVAREKNRIDISIKSRNASTAIIIENKINDAPDQDNQIPRYYYDIKNGKNENFEDIYIVYLPLTPYKYPDKSTWKKPDDESGEENWEKDRKYIEEHLIHLPAYSIKNTSISLLNNWVDEYIQYSKGKDNRDISDSFFILRQYKELITFLGEEQLEMNKSEELFNIVTSNENLNFDKIKKLVEAYKKIPQYLAQKMSEEISKKLESFYCKNNVFDSTKRGQESEWVFKLDKPTKNYEKIIPNVLRFSFRADEIRIHLWTNSEGTGKIEELLKIKPFLGNNLEDDFKEISTEERKEYVNPYKLEEYDEMVSFVENKLIPTLETVK